MEGSKNYIVGEAQGWQIDRIIRMLDERRVSGRAAARILAILVNQPRLNEHLHQPRQHEKQCVPSLPKHGH